MDPIQSINDAFWTVVLPEFSEEPVYVDGSDRFSKFLKALYKAPGGDDPTLLLEFVGQEHKPSVRTLGMNRTDDTTDYVIAERYMFRIGIKSRKNGTGIFSPIWASIKKGLDKVYPHLGIAASLRVSDFQLSVTQPPKGYKSAVMLTVLCRPMKSQVVA